MGYYMAGGETPAFRVKATDESGNVHYLDSEPMAPRRMNKFNGRALSRAMRRAKGFEKMARKAVAFTRRVHFIKRKRG